MVYIWPFERAKFILVYKYQLQSHLKVAKAIYPPSLLISVYLYTDFHIKIILTMDIMANEEGFEEKSFL